MRGLDCVIFNIHNRNQLTETELWTEREKGGKEGITWSAGSSSKFSIVYIQARSTQTLVRPVLKWLRLWGQRVINPASFHCFCLRMCLFLLSWSISVDWMCALLQKVWVAWPDTMAKNSNKYMENEKLWHDWSLHDEGILHIRCCPICLTYTDY